MLGPYQPGLPGRLGGALSARNGRLTVAELMGHARLETTRIYTLPTKAHRERALDALLTDR